jgi:hypothetical protein
MTFIFFVLLVALLRSLHIILHCSLIDRLIAVLAVNKLLDTAQPSVEFTRRKYVEAHDAIVASAAYNRALEAAAQLLHKVRAQQAPT